MAFTKITPAYSHAWGKIKNAAFARYVLCVLYLISRAVSVPSDSGMKTKTLCCTFSATLCCRRCICPDQLYQHSMPDEVLVYAFIETWDVYVSDIDRSAVFVLKNLF